MSDTYLALSNLSDGGKMAFYKYGSSSQTILNALSISRLANPNLEWRRHQPSTSVLISLFSVSVYSIEWYNKITKDMIMYQRLPNFTGFSNIATNLGEITNSGIEITLNSKNIDTPNFKWNTTVGFSYNKNRIKHLYYDYDENGKSAAIPLTDGLSTSLWAKSGTTR